MASSSFSPQQPPPPPTTTVDYPDPPLGVPLLLPAPPPPPSSSRRLPPPCWTPDETSALIDAYREKWYSLRRGNLRAAHWQDVAEQIHRLCPDVTPPKTAVQCRHKMEKLRKRYRAELQRAKSIPHHRFSSAWVYFSKMDSMEKGVSSSPNQNPPPNNNNNSNNMVSSSSVVVTDDLVKDEFDDDEDDDNDNNDDVNDEDYRAGSFHKRNGLRIRIANNSKKNYGRFQQESPIPNPNPNPNSNSKFGYKSRFPEFSAPPQFEERQRFAPRFVNNGASSGGGGASSGGGGGGGSGIGSSSGLGMNMGMGMGMGMGMNLIKKKRSALGRKRGREREKGDKVAAEMVEAIRVLGDGFLRTEMMKMEMIRESERIRMENEMKRTQMFLQSQHNLIESFIKGWSDLIASNRDNDDDDDDHNTNNNTTTKDAS